MKILEIKTLSGLTNEECAELIKKRTETDTNGVYMYIPKNEKEDEFIMIKTDPEEFVPDTTDDDSMYSYMHGVWKDIIENRDNYEIDDDDFDIIVDKLEEELAGMTCDISKYDDFDSEVDESEDIDKLIIRTIPGDNFVIPMDTINWDHNIEIMGDIENNMIAFHESIREMMAGRIQPDEVINTADTILGNLNINIPYIFPQVEATSKREIALLKMFDAYAAYATLYSNTAYQKSIKDANNAIQELIYTIQNANINDADDVSDVIEAAEDIKNEG